MTTDIGVEKPQPTWPIAAALGISGLLFFLYIYTLIAPIIRNPNIIAPYSTRQAGRSRRKSKSSWLSRWLMGAGTPRHLQAITPSQSRTSRRTANHDLESLPSSSTSHSHHAHAYFPSSPSSAKLSPHPITPSHPSFHNTLNPSYHTLHSPLTPSFSTSPTGVRVSRLDHDLPSHNLHARGGQLTLSPPPPAYVSSPNTPSPDYAPVFVDQTSGYVTPPMSPGAHSTRTPSAEGGASIWSYYSPSALASPSASSFNGAMSRSPSSHSLIHGLTPPSPSYDGSPATLAVPPFNRGPVGRSISGSSAGSASSASMYSASSAFHQQPPSSQGHPSPPSRHGHLDAAQTLLRADGPVQKSPPRVLTKQRADKGQDKDALNHFPLPPPLTVRTTNTGPYTPKITTSASAHAVGSQTTQYWPPGSQLPTPPVSAAPSSSSQSYHHPSRPTQPPSPSNSSVKHPYPPPSPRQIRESLSDSAVHSLTPERLARQPILAAHMYPRNEAGAPMVHLRASPNLRGTAGKI